MKNKSLKAPNTCENMEDIRHEIDLIDREIVSLLGKRFGYVKRAAAFKTSPETVKAPDRFKRMMEKRVEWAKEEGLDPELVKDLYTNMVNFFIAKEMDEWEKK